MSEREEYRVQGLPSRSATTPTRCAPATCSSSRAASRSTARGRLVRRDDVVAQARQVFANIGAVLAAAGATFADVVKVTVFLTDIDDRARDQPGAAGVLRRHAAGEHARRGQPRSRSRGEARGRGGRADPVTDAWNAVITGGRAGAGRGRARCTGKRLLVKDLIDTAGIRTTYGSKIYADHVPERTAPAVAAARRRRRRRRRQGEPARVRVGRDEPEPVVRHGRATRRTRADDRRLVGRQRGRARGRPLRPRPRHRHGLLDPAPGGLLRARRAQAALGPDPDRRRLPARARRFDTVGPMARTVADVALDVVGARGEPVPEPRARRAHRRAADAAAVGRRRRAAGATARPSSTSSGSRRSARASSRRRSPSRPATPGRSSTTRRRVAPRDVPVARGRVRRQRAREARARAGGQARRGRAAHARRSRAGATYRPPVDLYVPPVLASTCRRRTATSSRSASRSRRSCARSTCSAGPALAIGNLQLVAPRDETVLAAGLAWER